MAPVCARGGGSCSELRKLGAAGSGGGRRISGVYTASRPAITDDTLITRIPVRLHDPPRIARRPAAGRTLLPSVSKLTKR